METNTPECVFCGITSDQVPLVALFYQNKHYWICSQHLPLFIHHPEQLRGKLPGAEKMTPGSHDAIQRE
jgi:hypothetical protein